MIVDVWGGYKNSGIVGIGTGDKILLFLLIKD
jgi:hypothetical protein